MTYNPQNVFACILRGELPCRKVYEDDFALAFYDLKPKAPVHVLIISKGPYISFLDFSRLAPAEEIAGFFRAVEAVASTLQLTEKGCRIVSNDGVEGGQEIPHFHVHLFGGRVLGPLLLA